MLLGGIMAALVGSFLLPRGLETAVGLLLFTPVYLVALPISLVVLAQTHVRSRPWLPGVVSSLSFALGWLAWASFNHYHP